MKRYLLVGCVALHGFMPSSLGAMEPQKESPSIEELCQKIRNFNVWQQVVIKKIEKGSGHSQDAPGGFASSLCIGEYEATVFDNYSRTVPYESWRLLLDERAQELEQEIAQHKDGDTIRRLMCKQNFCWVNPHLFKGNDVLRAEAATAVVLQPKEVFVRNKQVARLIGYGLEEVYCYPDTIQKIGPRSCFTDYDQEILSAQVIPGMQSSVISALSGGKYVLKVTHPYERLEHPLKIKGSKPVLRVAVDTCSVAWTALDEKSQLRLKVWQSDEGEVLDEEIYPKEANFPFAWRRAPTPITAVAIGTSQIRICDYEKKVLSQKLKVAGTRDYTIGSEPILDVARVPKTASFALLTQSHAHLVRCHSAREFSWNKTIVLPICPHQFSFSPDAESLAVAGIKKETGDNRNLYVIDLTTGEHTENLADHLDLEQVNQAGPAFKVTMLSYGMMHFSSELISEKKSIVSFKTREQLLLPIDFKTLLVLKALQQVCVHPSLVQCAEDFGYQRTHRNLEVLATFIRTKDKYLDAIEKSNTFQECPKIWQTVLKAAIADEHQGLQCTDDLQKSDKEFMNETGSIKYVPVLSGIRHLMKKMASECKKHE